MKWLIVTTNPEPHMPGTAHPHGAGWNVGDCFARIGTEQVIRDVDPLARIEIVNMDSRESILTEKTFDRAVFAGRPMFWQGCESHPLWSELLNGWLCRDPRKVMALGVGDCFPLPTPAIELTGQIEAATRKLWRLTLRRRGFSDFIPCPATWILLDREVTPSLRLCNLMEFGAHYPDFDRHAAIHWNSKLTEKAADLQRRGFEFVAHSLAEAKLARRLGWGDRNLHFATQAAGYLAIYARAAQYIGNRVHGALILASRPADGLAVILDSRVYAVTAAGMSATHVTSADLEPSPNPPVARIDFIRRQRAEAVKLLKEFAQ